MIEWISVEDRLPRQYRDVLLSYVVYSGDAIVNTGHLSDKAGREFFVCGIDTWLTAGKEITHWAKINLPGEEK